MASYLDKQGLQTFLDCLREEELSPIQNDVSNLQQTKADNETVVNGLASVESKVDEGVETLKEVAQAFGITSATEYTPMTDSEIESEMITIWNNAFNN